MKRIFFSCMAMALVAGCSKSAPKPGYAEVAIHVTTDGFVPKSALVARGKPVTLVVTRDTDQTCATAMVVAGSDREWLLPLHRAVRIDLPQGVTDTLRYVCTMGMEHGEVVAE
ncbi:MAG: cupredoxin domain-containing protein [Candidatus Eiseniibacteriota bacterium]